MSLVEGHEKAWRQLPAVKLIDKALGIENGGPIFDMSN